MTEGKKKRDWVRIGLDVSIPVVLAILSWAGVVLWGMSKAQITLYESQKNLVVSVTQIQESQNILQRRMGEQELWKAETSGNRFTVNDGHELWKEVAKIRENMATLPLGEPPDWFIRRVDGMAGRIDELEHRMNGL